MLARVHKVPLHGLSQSTSTGSDLRPSVNIRHQKQVRANLKTITQSQEPVILALKSQQKKISDPAAVTASKNEIYVDLSCLTASSDPEGIFKTEQFAFLGGPLNLVRMSHQELLEKTAAKEAEEEKEEETADSWSEFVCGMLDGCTGKM